MDNLRLADFCKIGSGGTPSRARSDRYYEGGTIPWVKSGELRESIIRDTEEHVTEAALRESGIKLLPTGALLLAMYGATVGRIGILGVPATTNQAVCHIIPDPGLADTRFLFHVLRGRLSHLLARRVGGAQPNISQGIVRDLSVPLPPLPEQRRIAAILDHAEALRAKRRQALTQLETLTQSLFLELFGDPITNAKGWPTIPLLDLFAFRTGKLDSNAAVPDGAYPFFTCSKEDFRIDRYAFDCEALLLAGNNATADYSVKYYKGKFNAYQRTYVINLKNASHSYAYARLALENKLAELKRFSKGTNTKYLTMGLLATFKIQVPAVSIQEQFEAQLKMVERLKAAQRASLAKMDELFASLQHRAFRGEL